MYAGWIDKVCGGSAEADGGGVGDDGGGEEGVEGCAEGGEVVKWIDGWICFGGGLGGGEVGWNEFFCFLFFLLVRDGFLWRGMVLPKWLVVEHIYTHSYVQKRFFGRGGRELPDPPRATNHKIETHIDTTTIHHPPKNHLHPPHKPPHPQLPIPKYLS